MATKHIKIDLLNPQLNANAGNCFVTVFAMTDYEAEVWGFLNGQLGNLYGRVKIPNDMAGTPNAGIIVTVSPGSATSGGNLRLQVSEARVANAASFNPATLTDETLISTAMPTTAHQRTDITFPASGNLGVTPVANDIFIVQISRDGANAADTFEADLHLYDAYLRIDVT